jgi:hypothetical protein
VNSIGKIIAITAAALAIAIVSAGAAQACGYTGAERVFKAWGDPNSYGLAPDGGFEAGGQGCPLAGGAKAANANEAFYLHGAGDSHSLALPAGSTAVSPPVCM